MKKIIIYTLSACICGWIVSPKHFIVAVLFLASAAIFAQLSEYEKRGE